MTDIELLEAAAKAAGYLIGGLDDKHIFIDDNGSMYRWNPLTDDGDALRLAVKLRLDINQTWEVVQGDENYPMASVHVSLDEQMFVYELKEFDSYAATRRAIVRGAAEIGRGKHDKS